MHLFGAEEQLESDEVPAPSSVGIPVLRGRREGGTAKTKTGVDRGGRGLRSEGGLKMRRT